MAYSTKKEDRGLYIFLGVSALIAFLFASSVLPFFGRGTAGFVPDVMLCFVCALPAFTDIKKGGIYALCLGFLADLFVTPPTSLSPFVFLACMCISHMCLNHFSRVGSLAVAICTLPSVLFKSLVSVISTAITVDGVNLRQALLKLSLTDFLGDFACAIVVAYLLRFACRRLRIRIQN